LLVFPSRIISIAGEGLLIALLLMLVARPASVFISLLFSRFRNRAKLMISWTGLRGAVPIIMATFPLAAGLPNADLIFSVVFFVVVTSALMQGPTLPLMARWLHVYSPVKQKVRYPIEFEPSVDIKGTMKEIEVAEGDPAVGKQVVELNFPDKALIVILNRDGGFLVPTGTTELQAHDKLLVLAQKEMMPALRELIKGKNG
jgi:cell volume regulation protein A